MKNKHIFVWLSLCLAAGVLFYLLSRGIAARGVKAPAEPTNIPYSQFIKFIEDKEVVEGTFRDDTFVGTLRHPIGGKGTSTHFIVVMPGSPEARAELFNSLRQSGVRYDIQRR